MKYECPDSLIDTQTRCLYCGGICHNLISNKLEIILRLKICTEWLVWKNIHFRFCFLLRSGSSAWISTWKTLVSQITYGLRLSGLHLHKPFHEWRLYLPSDYLLDLKLSRSKHSGLIWSIFLFLISRAIQPINCTQTHLTGGGSGFNSIDTFASSRRLYSQTK